MSNTIRWTQPTWTPAHPRWNFDPDMTPKHQSRDRGRMHYRHDRFRNGHKNSMHNLQCKAEATDLAESLREHACTENDKVTRENAPRRSS